MFSLTLFAGTTTYASSNLFLFETHQEKEYRKIETTQVPTDILKSIGAKYAGYSLEEAYVSEDAEYKVVLLKDEKKITAIYKATGEFVKEAYLNDAEKAKELAIQKQKLGVIIKDTSKLNYLSVDERIILKLQTEGKLFKKEKYEHTYPHCWRTDKPILYYPPRIWKWW